MNIRASMLPETPAAAGVGAIIKLAILAVGGQGGGVLTDWIVDLAERNGYRAQATSVPGVAQRTGATVYYVEMTPDTGRMPVFALMPSPGDVDIMIAAEMMEAGRAIMRGFVTPDRTTLIASAHRALAVSEKIVPGDGIASPDEVLAAAELASRRFIAFDMDRIATDAGSVISASLFGALAGSGSLPFARESFRETIEASGRGVQASLRAFDRAFERTIVEEAAPGAEVGAITQPPSATGPAGEVEKWTALTSRIARLPEAARDMASRGLAKVVDFQDAAYGAEYLDRLERVARVEAETGPEGSNHALTVAAAKHIANAMVYDDVIRVADLKTRGARFDRVRGEVGVKDGSVLQLTEFMHPRGEEVVGMLPARLGRWIEARPRLFARLDRAVNRGRRVRTDSVFWFTMLYALGGMRRWRRRLLRHAVEQAHLEDWLDRSLETAARNYGAAVEMINCRRLVKGYSDTHARGLSKFDRVFAGAMLVRDREDAADWIRRLREAALKDEKGSALDGALMTVRSFVENPERSEAERSGAETPAG